MVIRLKQMAASLASAALLSVGAQQAMAQHHDHAHEKAAQAQLTLNKGQKWVTDDNLRLGMSRIRDALTAQLPSIRAGKATTKQYRAVAQQTNEQIEFMVQKCKLEPAADAMLHLLLADIIAGAEAMQQKKGNDARKGAEKIAHTLEKYGAYFEHPGWQGIRHDH